MSANSQYIPKIVKIYVLQANLLLFYEHGFVTFRVRRIENNMSANYLKYHILDASGDKRFKPVVTGLFSLLRNPMQLNYCLTGLMLRCSHFNYVFFFCFISEIVSSAKAFIICYDLTDRKSFESSFYWDNEHVQKRILLVKYTLRHRIELIVFVSFAIIISANNMTEDDCLWL